MTAVPVDSLPSSSCMETDHLVWGGPVSFGGRAEHKKRMLEFEANDRFAGTNIGLSPAISDLNTHMSPCTRGNTASTAKKPGGTPRGNDPDTVMTVPPAYDNPSKGTTSPSRSCGA